MHIENDWHDETNSERYAELVSTIHLSNRPMAIKHNKGIPPYSYEISRGYVFWTVMCSQHSLAYGGATDVFKSMGGKKVT